MREDRNGREREREMKLKVGEFCKLSRELESLVYSPLIARNG